MNKNLAILAFLAYFFLAVEASLQRTSSAALVTFTICAMNVGVSGFFGIFRRRRPAPAIVQPKVEEMSSAPNGPVSLFSQRPPGLFSNPFAGFGAGFPGMGIPRPQIFGNMFQRQDHRQDFQQQLAQQMTEQQIPQHMQDQVFQQMQGNEVNSFEDFASDQSQQGPSPGLNTEEAESFFALLAETDESQCISRLICEMGADPMRAGEFGQTITEIISNLQDFPPGSKASHYNQVMQAGMQGGVNICRSNFATCDDESLQMVKNAQTSES